MYCIVPRNSTSPSGRHHESCRSVVERGDGARFLLEAQPQVGIAGESGGHHVDRDGAIEAGVARFVDLAHPARPEGGHDFVSAEAGSGRQRHAIAPIIVR